MAVAAAPTDRDELRRRWADRAIGLARYERWEATQAAEPESPDAIARIGALFDLLPPENRRQDPDPGKLGIQAMHRALAVLGGGRR